MRRAKKSLSIHARKLMISIAAPQADAPLCTMRKACDFSLVSSACRDQQIEVGPTTKELAEKGFIVVEKDEPRTVRLTPRGYALVGLVRSNPASVAFILSDSAEELTPEEQTLICWLLQNGFPGAEQYLPQVDQARVVGRCCCGCPSIDLARSSGSVTCTPPRATVSCRAPPWR